MALTVTISEDRDIVILELTGRIDSFAIDELNEGFDKAMKTGKEHILIIMKDLEYINSRGIGTLMSFFKWVKKVGKLVKIAEVPLNIMQVLNLLGLDGLTLIYDSASDAVESFRRQQIKREPPEAMEPPEPGLRAVGRSVQRGNRMLVFLLAGALLVIFLLFVLFQTRDQGPPGEVDLEPLNRRLDVLEGRLARLEAGAKTGSSTAARIEAMTKALSERVEEVAGTLEKIKGEVSSMDRGSAQTVAPGTPARPLPRYHQVQPGESLYRIGRRYGISVLELSRINNIKTRNVIHPGQKLIVGFSGDEGG